MSLVRNVLLPLVVAGSVLSGTLPVHAQPLPVAEVGPALVTQNATLVESIISAVKDSAQVTKDWVLDDLAYQVANLAIESMTKSTVNWINSGFQGSPAFVTDLNTNLRGVGDAVADRFFDELSNQSITTTPFQDKVLDTVRLGYYLRTSPESFYERNPYTLNQVSADDRAFLQGDFSQGGFNAWFSAVMNPQNNPYGAQMLADEALTNVVANATNNRLQELSWNRGFLSWRGDCVATDDIDAISLTGADPCVEYEIKTPGSVIMESLNKVQGVPFDRLVSADEFNEIIGALLNQLALQVIGGGDGGGVRGLSQPSSGGGPSYTSQLGTGVGTRSSTSLGQGFMESVRRKSTELATYRTNWERIRSAAQAAEARCGTENPEPARVLALAEAALVDAASSTAAIDEIIAAIDEAVAAGGNQTQAFLEINELYVELINSDSFPTPEEYAASFRESADTGSVEPGSLYSQMQRLSSGSCSTS